MYTYVCVYVFVHTCGVCLSGSTSKSSGFSVGTQGIIQLKINSLVRQVNFQLSENIHGISSTGEIFDIEKNITQLVCFFSLLSVGRNTKELILILGIRIWADSY